MKNNDFIASKIKIEDFIKSYGVSSSFVDKYINDLSLLFSLKFHIPEKYLIDLETIIRNIEKIGIKQAKSIIKQILNSRDYSNLNEKLKEFLNS